MLPEKKNIKAGVFVLKKEQFVKHSPPHTNACTHKPPTRWKFPTC